VLIALCLAACVIIGVAMFAILVWGLSPERRDISAVPWAPDVDDDWTEQYPVTTDTDWAGLA
jgi:hypothetical protein